MDQNLSTEDEEIFLYVDRSPESRLAQRYLEENGVNPQVQVCRDVFPAFIFHATSPVFQNSFKEPLIPSLIDRDRSKSPLMFSYVSFSGVKSFLRGKIRAPGGKGKFYWRDIKTFYPRRDLGENGKSGKKEKLVTCFDRDQQRIFEGPIDCAPFTFAGILDSHDFKDWYEVSCWSVGNLEEIAKKQSRTGPIFDDKTKTVLFPDEIEMLRHGKNIVTVDSRSNYHVTFEAYFSDNGQLFGVYADMVD